MSGTSPELITVGDGASGVAPFPPPRTRGNAEGNMRSLIAEDDSTSRTLLHTLLSQVGGCDAARNGREAVEAFVARLHTNSPYDLVCLDIMMPELDGQAAL